MSISTTAAERSLYDSINRHLNEQEWGDNAIFLNYGYVPDDAPHFAQVDLAKELPSRNSTRLVLETIGDCVLDGKDILDVGCGRGGTLTTIRRFFNPGTLTGVDLSSVAIAFCRTHHGQNARFLAGNAENLPLKSESFDAVINIESACCYPNMLAFYEEVHRVLRPGGHFLYTDNIATELLDSRLDSLREHFVVERLRDITHNVLLSCDEIAARRLSFIDSSNGENFMAGVQHAAKPKTYEKLIKQLLCMPGSKNYNRMLDREDSYVIVKLRKTQKPSAGA